MQVGALLLWPKVHVFICAKIFLAIVLPKGALVFGQHIDRAAVLPNTVEGWLR